MDYSKYQELHCRILEPGILEIVMGRDDGKLSTAGARMHAEMAEIWRDIDRDPEVRVAILRGAGKGFSAGGDFKLIDDIIKDFDTRARVWREARDLVYNMLNCSKPIISASKRDVFLKASIISAPVGYFSRAIRAAEIAALVGFLVQSV